MSKAKQDETTRIATVQIGTHISAQGMYCGLDKEGRHRVRVGQVYHSGALVGPEPAAVDITAS